MSWTLSGIVEWQAPAHMGCSARPRHISRELVHVTRSSSSLVALAYLIKTSGVLSAERYYSCWCTAWMLGLYVVPPLTDEGEATGDWPWRWVSMLSMLSPARPSMDASPGGAASRHFAYTASAGLPAPRCFSLRVSRIARSHLSAPRLVSLPARRVKLARNPFLPFTPFLTGCRRQEGRGGGGSTTY